MTHTDPVACMRVPICVCVCVCARVRTCVTHTQARRYDVIRAGSLVNGTLVGAPRRRRGEQHVEKGSRRATSILEASLRVPFGQFGPWSFKNRPVFPTPVHRESPTSLSGEKLDERGTEAFDFRHPFKEKYGSGKGLNGRNVSLCGGFWKGSRERGDSSTAGFMKEKKIKKLCYAF